MAESQNISFWLDYVMLVQVLNSPEINAASEKGKRYACQDKYAAIVYPRGNLCFAWRFFTSHSNKPNRKHVGCGSSADVKTFNDFSWLNQKNARRKGNAPHEILNEIIVKAVFGSASNGSDCHQNKLSCFRLRFVVMAMRGVFSEFIWKLRSGCRWHQSKCYLVIKHTFIGEIQKNSIRIQSKTQ